VTAQTAYTVTVAWNPPRHNSGNFNYYLSGAYGVTPAVLPNTATSHTFTRLHSGNQYWFFIYARDAGGNTSGTVSTTTRTLADTTPPSTGPVITVTEIGSNYVTLSWTPAQDDCPFLSYQVSVNGDPYTAPSPNLSATLRFLQPQTTYSLTVRGRDEGQFWSPFSDPVSVTTLPPNPNDHTPPSTPANLSAYSFGDGSTEMQIQWAQSTDDLDAQANIRYDVYVNGSFEDVRFWFQRPDHRLRRFRRKHDRSHRLGYCRQRIASRHDHPIHTITFRSRSERSPFSREIHPLYPRNSRFPGADAISCADC
jgi:chitodextrinase